MNRLLCGSVEHHGDAYFLLLIRWKLAQRQSYEQ
jgi:hypothetical protein